MDVARRGDVIYGRDASALRSREVKKRTRPDYSTRTGRNVQLSAPKLGLRHRVMLRDPEVTSYVGYWLIDVPAKTFSIYSHFRCLHGIPATLAQAKFRTGDSVTKRFIYLAVHVTASNFVWMKPRIPYIRGLLSAKAIMYPPEI